MASVWNAAAVVSNLQKLARAYPLALEVAAKRVGRQVLNDCVMESPTVPKKTGNLRSSGSFEVFSYGDGVRLVVGYNTPYAAKVHEMPETTNWTTPSSGPHYLSEKIVRHRAEYVRMWAIFVNEKLGIT